LNKNNIIINKIVRIFAKILAGILVFLLLIILFVRSPWGQGIIKDQLISFVSNKTETEVDLERLFITFSGNIQLDGLFLEDKEGDTLIHSRSLEADIPIWPLIRENSFSIDNLDWKGLKANIHREDSLEGFNFQFLIDAFVPNDTTSVAQDTTSAPMEINIGNVNLEDFDIIFKDDVTGIDSRLSLGLLDVKMEMTDLKNMDFRIIESELRDVAIYYLQTKPFPESDTQEEQPLPYLVVNSLELHNVQAHYESVPDGILLDTDIQEFQVEVPLADLEDNRIEINYLALNDSDVLIETTPVPEQENAAEEETNESEAFEWPEWNVVVNQISLQDNNISYFADDAQPEEGEFNANALVLENLFFNAQVLYLQEKTAGGRIEKVEFREASGIELKEFAVTLEANDSSFNVSNIDFTANNSHLQGEMDVEYESLATFIQQPENAYIALEFPSFELDLNDIFLFQPDLIDNEYILALSRKNIYGNLSASGPLSHLEIPTANFNWGQNTTITARGTLHNPTNAENISFNFPEFKFRANRGDLNQFINEEELGISLPQEVKLSGNFSGNPEDIEAVAFLNTSEGNIDLRGNFRSEEEIAFNADIEIRALQLGNIMQNEQIGSLNLTLKASGEGTDINTMDAVVQTNISSFRYNEYDIVNLSISGEIEDGDGNINSEYKDDNLDLALDAFVQLDSVSPQVDVNLDLAGANLQAIGLTEKNIRVAFVLDGYYKGNAETYDVNAEIIDGIAIHDDDSYLLGDFRLSANVSPDSTSLIIDNQMIDLNLHSNTDPASFASALQRHYQSYLSDHIETDTVDNPVNLVLRAEIRQNPILDEVFISNLQELDTIEIAVDFKEKERELMADIELPFINFRGNEIDSLSFHLDSNREKFDFVLGFEALNAGPLAIRKTDLEGAVIDQTLHLDFNSYFEEEHLMHIQSEIARREDTTVFSINPSELILNSGLWDVPETNEILIGENFVTFNDFNFMRNNQTVKVTTENPEVEGEHIAISFDNFRLANFLAYFNPEEPLATGRLNGNFTIEDPYGTTGLLAGLEIIDFNLMQVPMGTLSMKAKAIGNENYTFNMAIKEGDVDLDLTGTFVATEEAAEWDTELLLNKVKMTAVEGFSQGEITNAKGSFSGSFSLSGTTAEPQYKGNIDFNNAGFTVAMLDAPFVLPDENLRIDNEGFYFESFDIEDQNNNRLTLNGEVLTESFINPEFDLTFEADDFMLLNSTSEDHDLFYGKAILDVDGSMSGTLNLPRVDMNLELGSETDLTYIMPEAEVAIEERDGVVIFVNRENPDHVLTQTEEESYTMTGMEIRAVISIMEDAAFNIIIDEQTGDNFGVTGAGDLNFNIYPNGRTTLSGRYEMSGGHYEMSLYNLVNRRFEIVKGSSITWAGDPMDANLDVRARYRVETSASSLMSAQTSGAGTSVRNRFRQELPFLVYLNVDGELMEPVLSFGLDMPEEEQGAIGGQVYGMIQQVNQQEQELNKQVFSLLVLNRFYPGSGSDGSAGGTMNIARDNLNNALSDQLNLLSNNLLGDSGFQLDFGLESYTDYQGEAPQDRTQLDITAKKTFMDERLVVRVGSEVDIQGSNQDPEATNPLIGNVSIEYLITESGVWRLRGFRRNSFENVIEGQVIISGLALIYTREFNEFRELWDRLKAKELEEEENNEE